uniref:ARAD1D28864p n=1 Tax=Blastobotrys adeninivorans TaxID=409370 RepID=A0A060TAU7_BLAAD
MSESIELSHRKRGPSASPALPLTENETVDVPLDDSSKSASGLLNLNRTDRANFFLLVGLYWLQGIPVGLAFGSVPFILKAKLSYGQVGIFTLASYPYSLKLLWSPIVDSIYSRTFGRRKSWIIPIQFMSSIVLLWLGASIAPYMEDAETHVVKITIFFFILVFLCATQDIAVDGWALTLLSPPSLSYASTAQTIGLNSGYFMSFTVFLAFNSPDFANRYFRSVPSDEPMITLSQYLTLWGVIYFFTTVLVGMFKKEERTKMDDARSIMHVYRSMIKVLKLKNVQVLIGVHLVAKFAFQANEAVTNLKLVEKGFSREDLALTVLIDFPFEIIFGYYTAKWANGSHPLKLWVHAYLGRLALIALAMCQVAFFPKDGAGFFFFLFIIVVHVLQSFMSTVMFVAINAFHTQIADPLIGGTYMTTLNTISNLGGQWPRLFIFYGVDFFTKATCTPPSDSPLLPFSCATDPEKKHCDEINGSCYVARDGYYVMNIICIAIGLALLFGWIRRMAAYLQRLPTSAWRVGGI